MVTNSGPPDSRRDGDVVAWVLGELRYRRLLSMLLEGPEPMPVRELAARLAARETDTGATAVADVDSGSVMQDLQHRCLPKLESVGWVSREPAGLVLTEPLPIETDELSVPDLGTPDHPHWEPISAVLGSPLRRTVVGFLADQQYPVTVERIARHLRACEHCAREAPTTDDRRLRTRLHHVALPKLESVGLVDYDTADPSVYGTPLLAELVEGTDSDGGSAHDSVSG